MDGDGVSIAVGSSAVTALVGVLGVWIKARWGQKARVEPVPLPVETEARPHYVTCEECKERHEKIERRFAQGNDTFKKLRDEMEGMRRDFNTEMAATRKDVNDGFMRLNDRISPVAEACAANSAAIQILLKERKP